MFNENDIQTIKSLGISEATVLEQLNKFKTGFPFLKLKAAATCGAGILRLSEAEQKLFEQKYDAFDGCKTKFVPASGAASRMFKALFEAKSDLENGANIDDVKSKNKIAKQFFENIEKFAFAEELKKCKPCDEKSTLEMLLTASGLNYGNLPKGLLLFHKYHNFVRTPFEEHLVEAANYACDSKAKKANLHFTVSDEHLDLFKTLLNAISNEYSKKYGIEYNISFSTQKKSTNTIAANENNEAFRNADGSLLFRPGGHGALLENLNQIQSDIVFIKNIDNVVPETKIAETAKWKKILAGVLLDCQQKIFGYIKDLKTNANAAKLSEISDFFRRNLCVEIPDNLDESALKSLLLSKLNRPIRVCGMVKNEGEPGGGPFVVYEDDGTTSLQILESVQIDTNDEKSKQMLANSTHFNPVDLVCAFKNSEGQKFNLPDFRDNKTGFISQKSQSGKTLKAQELPGLWNGAMSNWNTIFVEVPIETFNPVKVVTDLLRKEHQIDN